MPKMGLRGARGRTTTRKATSRARVTRCSPSRPINPRVAHNCSQLRCGLLVLSNQRRGFAGFNLGFQKVTLVSHLHFLSSLQGLTHASPCWWSELIRNTQLMSEKIWKLNWNTVTETLTLSKLLQKKAALLISNAREKTIPLNCITQHSNTITVYWK